MEGIGRSLLRSVLSRPTPLAKNLALTVQGAEAIAATFTWEILQCVTGALRPRCGLRTADSNLKLIFPPGVHFAFSQSPSVG